MDLKDLSDTEDAIKPAPPLPLVPSSLHGYICYQVTPGTYAFTKTLHKCFINPQHLAKLIRKMLLSGTKQFQRQHGLRQQNKQALEQNTQQFTSNFGPSSIQLYKCRHNEEHCEMSRTVRWYRINGRRRAKEQNRTDYGKHTSEKNNDSRRNGQRETIVKLSKVARCTSVAVSLLLLLTFSVTHVECSRADSVAGRSFRTALLCTRSHITLVIGAPKQFNVRYNSII